MPNVGDLSLNLIRFSRIAASLRARGCDRRPKSLQSFAFPFLQCGFDAAKLRRQRLQILNKRLVRLLVAAPQPLRCSREWVGEILDEFLETACPFACSTRAIPALTELPADGRERSNDFGSTR